MEPKIVNREAFTVMGLTERFTDENEDVGGLWGKFGSHRDSIRPFATDEAYCGVAFQTDQEGTWDYLAGMVVADVSPDSIPDGVVVRKVSAACYAVVECTLETMDETFKFIYEDWLPSSAYERDKSGSVLDCYPPGTDSGDSPVVLYVPIVRADEGEE
jgi:predicted transcriptional regulator YdeE